MAIKQLKGSAQEYEDVDSEALDVQAEDISDLMNDVDSELDQVTSEFGKDKNDVNLKIKLHRVLERKGEREWLFDILPSELPIMDRVKEEYGGGRYEASLFKNGKLYRKFNFNIANPKMKDVTKTLTGEMGNIVTLLVAQQEKSFNQLKDLMLAQQKPVPQVNMLEMMTGMVAMMVNMKNLLPVPIVGNSNDNIELLLKGMEVMRDFGNSGGDRETNLMDLVKEVIKSPFLEKALEGISTAVPNTVSIPNQVLAKPILSKSTISQSNPEPNTMNPIIKGYINQLVKKASQDADPELYAAFILDNVPEETVKQYLLRDDLMTFITSVNPQATQYVEWFEELKNNIKEILADESDENLTDTSNRADTSTDASTAVHSNEPAAREGRDESNT